MHAKFESTPKISLSKHSSIVWFLQPNITAASLLIGKFLAQFTSYIPFSERVPVFLPFPIYNYSICEKIIVTALKTNKISIICNISYLLEKLSFQMKETARIAIKVFQVSKQHSQERSYNAASWLEKPYNYMK